MVGTGFVGNVGGGNGLVHSADTSTKDLAYSDIGAAFFQKFASAIAVKSVTTPTPALDVDRFEAYAVDAPLCTGLCNCLATDD